MNHASDASHHFVSEHPGYRAAVLCVAGYVLNLSYIKPAYILYLVHIVVWIADEPFYWCGV